MPSFNFRLLRYKLIFAIFVWLLVQSTNTASALARGSITYVLENTVIPGRYMPIPLLSSPFEEVRSYSKESVGPEMAIKRPKPKEIVVKLRQVTQFDAHSRN
jgi:hypothetical protein